VFEAGGGAHRLKMRRHEIETTFHIYADRSGRAIYATGLRSRALITPAAGV